MDLPPLLQQNPQLATPLTTWEAIVDLVHNRIAQHGRIPELGSDSKKRMKGSSKLSFKGVESTADGLIEGGLAAAIHGAATDGKAQLRCLIGPDAEQLVGLWSAQGNDAYVAAVKQQMLSQKPSLNQERQQHRAHDRERLAVCGPPVSLLNSSHGS